MKLYYSPGACSLADHIALHEAGLTFDVEKVDIRARKTASGGDYLAVNPKGYVPALTLDGGETISENIAILNWVADQAPKLAPEGALGRTRLIEALAFISTEIHKSFKPFFMPGSTDEAKQTASETIVKRMDYLVGQIGDGDYLFGHQVSVADAYLFVMLLWADKMGVPAPAGLASFKDRMMNRDGVRTAMKAEGLI